MALWFRSKNVITRPGCTFFQKPPVSGRVAGVLCTTHPGLAGPDMRFATLVETRLSQAIGTQIPAADMARQVLTTAEQATMLHAAL